MCALSPSIGTNDFSRVSRRASTTCDFSMSLGFREPRKNDPKVQDAMKRTCEIAARHEKWASIPLGEPFAVEAKHYADLGFRMLEVGHDVAILASVWKKAIGEIGALRVAIGRLMDGLACTRTTLSCARDRDCTAGTVCDAGVCIEDPAIDASGPDGKHFSAWDYARRRSREMCKA